MIEFGAYLHTSPALPWMVDGETAPIAMEGVQIQRWTPPEDMRPEVAESGTERWSRRSRGGGGGRGGGREDNSRYDGNRNRRWG